MCAKSKAARARFASRPAIYLRGFNSMLNGLVMENRRAWHVGSRRAAWPGRRDVAIAAAISGSGRASERLHSAIVLAAHDYITKSDRSAVAQHHHKMFTGPQPHEGSRQGSAPLGFRGRIHRRARSGTFRCGHRLWKWSHRGLPAVTVASSGRIGGGRRVLTNIFCCARFACGSRWSRIGVAHGGSLRRTTGDERCEA